jgi:hypothetical protein
MQLNLRLLSPGRLHVLQSSIIHAAMCSPYALKFMSWGRPKLVFICLPAEGLVQKYVYVYMWIGLGHLLTDRQTKGV